MLNFAQTLVYNLVLGAWLELSWVESVESSGYKCSLIPLRADSSIISAAATTRQIFSSARHGLEIVFSLKLSFSVVSLAAFFRVVGKNPNGSWRVWPGSRSFCKSLLLSSSNTRSVNNQDVETELDTGKHVKWYLAIFALDRCWSLESKICYRRFLFIDIFCNISSKIM